MKTTLAFFSLLPILASLSAAQIAEDPAAHEHDLTRRVETPAGRGSICADTGVMRLGDSPVAHKVTSTHNVFSNTDVSGYYTVWGTTSEAVDYAEVFRSTESKAVMLYEFAYATSTNNSGPIALCNLIYEGYWGGCSAVGLGIQASGGFCWSGLPGCINPPYNGWTFTVWTTTTPLWYQDNDVFLHGMIFFDTMTGPSLRYAGTALNAAKPDHNNQIGMYADSYAPDVSNSTACGGFGCPCFNMLSWHLYVDQVDAAASTQAECNWYCGSGTNSDFFTTYVVREREGIAWQCSMVVSAPHVGAVVAGYLGQLIFPIWGQEGLVDITKPEVMGMPSGFGSTVQITWPVPPNLRYVGYHVFLQSAAFGGGIELSCAYDCTVGY